MSATRVLNHKRESHEFDPVQLHESIVAACLAVQAYEGEAHSTAQRVVMGVIQWLASKTEVTSSDIRRVSAEQLTTYHPEAAYMYQHMETMI